MIKTRKDLRFYLKEDRQRNLVTDNWFGYHIRLLAGQEHAHVYRYIRCLRYCEYHLNNRKKLLHNIAYAWYMFRLMRLGKKYKMKISPNVCGYGLRIMHICGGGGVLINAKKVGNYCGFNAGVLIGNKGGQENRVTIGDHTAFGPGAKAFGKLKIGSHVFVAPNAVVTKDVPDNCIVGGVPAKIIKYKEE